MPVAQLVASNDYVGKKCDAPAFVYWWP